MDEKTIKENVGAKIKKYRQAKHLTQFKLGEFVDINQRQIALIESGKSFPSLPTLMKMSEIFECTISDLFSFESYDSEDILKEELINIIKKIDYENCKRLYAVIKNFIEI